SDYRKDFPVLLDRKAPNLIGINVTEHSSQI
ncbi:carbon-nitrogen family hydrolase, partial [Leptospira borgpetersenii serovar Hardjo-bovis]|nr:carbon-nitrogen family hydrolase [Leptospira borgpetersenii serovar Hardjo-bovis]